MLEIKVKEQMLGDGLKNWYWMAVAFALWVSVGGWAEPGSNERSQDCQEILSQPSRIKELDRAFEAAFCQKDVYHFQKCHGNVIRLYQEFKTQIPSIEPHEFRVLYITTERWRTDFFDDVGFHVNQARGGFLKGEFRKYLVWRYHVVLEYQGRIYDLDFQREAKPIEKSKYLKEFFMNHHLLEQHPGDLVGLPEELLVLVVPGEEYLSHSAKETNEEGFHRKVLAKYPPKALVSYLLEAD